MGHRAPPDRCKGAPDRPPHIGSAPAPPTSPAPPSLHLLQLQMAVGMLPENARAVAGFPDAEQGGPVDVAEEPAGGVVDPAEALHTTAGVGRNVLWEETGKED